MRKINAFTRIDSAAPHNHSEEVGTKVGASQEARNRQPFKHLGSSLLLLHLRVLWKLLIRKEFWLRGKDLNLRPLGYEPNELPDCSTPHNYLSVCRPRGQILVTYILRPPLVQ